MRGAALIGLLFLGLTSTGVAQRQPDRPTWPPPIYADPALEPLTASRLETFGSEGEFRSYLTGIQRYNRERQDRIRRATQRVTRAATPGTHALVQDSPPECIDPECFEGAGEESGDSIVVTGSVSGRASNAAPARSSNARAGGAPNITNVQTAGVDEGDVVKQIGDYLVVLQDGRLFVVAIGGDRLRLVGRTNVYTDRTDGAWYDEMLVQGDRIIVTAYSYSRSATEISVFRLDQRTGSLARDGRFYLTSYDYYSGDNYASRIVGNNLVLYTFYHAAQITSDVAKPRIWRWSGDETPQDRRRRAGQGQSLIDAGRVHRPVLRTNNPFVHAITVCPLGRYDARTEPDCRTTAFTGPAAREFYVSPEAIYLWTGEAPWSNGNFDFRQTQARCGQGGPASFADATPAAVYRVPMDGTAPGVIGLRGQPTDQFAIDMTRDTFRMLGAIRRADCYQQAATMALVNVPLDRFQNRFAELPAARHVMVPSPGPGELENRFADDWLVYGGRGARYGTPQQARRDLIIVPVDDPAAAQRLTLPHNVVRLERVGMERMAINGYGTQNGLNISLLQLGGRARVVDSALLADRFESENRSHAFNSMIDEHEAGLIGVPTVAQRRRGARRESNSDGSDVSFLSVTAAGRLTDVGALTIGSGRPQDGYRCEVSCIDWYGNSRPIFTEGRIFALMGAEIAEGTLGRSGIRERRRIGITESTRSRR